MLRAILRWMLGTVALLAMLYTADWAAWRVRLGRGTGTDQVEVSRVSIASLKGNKEEYYSDGTYAADCSRSLFPVVLDGVRIPPCWWLRRHPQTVEKD